MAIIKIKVKGDPYNFETIESFARRAGVSKNYIYSLLSKIDEDTEESVLDYCYPIPNSDEDEDEKTGPKCIVLNAKALNYIDSRKEEGNSE